jgi:preprotein translocase subunit SecG
MVYYVLATIYVLICGLLLVVVLLQQGKGGDIAAAFGGASSQTAFGARAGATVLTRATAILGALFMIGAMTLTILGRTGGGSSVVGGIDAPAGEAAPALPAGTLPATPPPAGGGSGSGSGSGSDPAPAPGTPPATDPAQGGGSDETGV